MISPRRGFKFSSIVGLVEGDEEKGSQAVFLILINESSMYGPPRLCEIWPDGQCLRLKSVITHVQYSVSNATYEPLKGHTCNAAIRHLTSGLLTRVALFILDVPSTHLVRTDTMHVMILETT